MEDLTFAIDKMYYVLTFAIDKIAIKLTLTIDSYAKIKSKVSTIVG